MAKRAQTAKRKPVKKRQTKTTKKKTSVGKLSLGLLLVIIFGYASIAIWEGKIDTSFLNDDEPAESTEPSPDSNSPSNETSLAPDLESYDLYFTKAFDFAWPAYSTDHMVIERPGIYTLRYVEAHEQAAWVAYQLSADNLKLDKFKRKDNFRKDPRVRTESATLSDYRGSEYDRGHLAPAADFSYNESALSQTFFMSNMSPQAPSFNQGIWKKLEDQVRDWATEYSHLYIVTGPILNDQLETIGSNKVSVPAQYFKIILDVEKPGIKAIAFLMNNEESSADLSSFVVTIDDIERLTGLDFFPSISDELENILESSLMTQDWF